MERAFAQAVRRYDEREDRLLSSLYAGLVLGSAEIIEAWREKLKGQHNREKPQLQAARSTESISEQLREYARKAGIGDTELAALLRPIRHRERPTRDLLMYLLWREGRFRLGHIAPHFGVDYSAVSRACRRIETQLPTDRALQRTVKRIVE